MLAERPRALLDGKVEVEVTILGGQDAGRTGRSLGKQRPAVAAVEHAHRGSGYRRIRCEPLVQRPLHSFVVRRGPTPRCLAPDWRVAA